MTSIDETGWRIGGEGAWLWVASEPDATLYEVVVYNSYDDPSARRTAETFRSAFGPGGLPLSLQ